MIKIHDRVKVQDNGYVVGGIFGEEMPGGTEGVVTDVKANAECASGFAVTWRELNSRRKNTCCASLLEVL